MFGAVAAGALASVLAACGGRHRRDDATASATPVSAPPGGTPPDTVMIIRHAEKPTGSPNALGITDAGEHDDESLTVRGWTRAGALVGLFDPRASDGTPLATRAGIGRPATIFAADPKSHGSKRPEETVAPLAQALGVPVQTPFPKGHEADLVTALAAARGPVLIAWEHENIAAIIEHMGVVKPTPPKDWPGDRFDVVYVFTRSGDGWTFTQVPQLLLAGDSASPIA